MNIYKMFTEGNNGNYVNLEFYRREDVDLRLALMDGMAEALKMSLDIIRKHENPELPGSAELRSISAIIDLYEDMKKQ